MKKILTLFLFGLACLMPAATINAAPANPVKPIKIAVPARPAGQKDVINLTTPKMSVVRVGVIGLGMRGSGTVEVLSHVPGVKIVALCDLQEKFVNASQELLQKAGLPKAASYVGATAYKQMCDRNDIDLVYVITDWLNHTPMAVYAMEHGKNVAIEVPAATTLKEIWQLINTK